MGVAGSVLGDEPDFLKNLHRLLMVFQTVVFALNAQTFLDDVFDRHTRIQGIHGVLENHLNFIQKGAWGMLVVIMDGFDFALLTFQNHVTTVIDCGDFFLDFLK